MTAETLMVAKGGKQRLLNKVFGDFWFPNAHERIAVETIAVLIDPAFRVHWQTCVSSAGKAGIRRRFSHEAHRTLPLIPIGRRNRTSPARVTGRVRPIRA